MTENSRGSTQCGAPPERIVIPLGIGLLCLISLTGCAHKLATIQTARNAYYTGDLATAEKTLDELVSQGGRFADAAELDLAIVQLASGDAQAAEKRLRKLRDQFDAPGATKPLFDAASMLTDETARKYQPAGYEQVMIRTLLSLCSIAGDASDAEAYANQAALKQIELQQAADARASSVFGDAFTPTPHQELAFAPYVRGVLRESTHHDFDDARRCYQLVSAIRPDFLPGPVDISRAEFGQHCAPGHGVLIVFALVGRGPILEPVDAPMTTAAMSIASSILVTQSGREDGVQGLPRLTSVKVPGVVVPPSPIAALAVGSFPIAGLQTETRTAFHGATQPLTDIADMVQKQVDAEMPWLIARVVTRQAGKELAVSTTRKSLGIDGGWGTLFQFAASNAWTATEQVDTRCWGLLPREIQVLRAELPVGEHVLQLSPLGHAGETIGAPVRLPITIRDATDTYKVVIAPDRQLHVVR